MKAAHMVIYLWEKNRNFPHIHSVKKLAEIFDVTVSHLIAGMPQDELLAIPTVDPESAKSRRIFALKIKFLRHLKGWTQEDMSQQLGVNKHTIANWELGTIFPSPHLLKELAKLFEIEVSRFLTGKSLQELLESRDVDPRRSRQFFGLKVKVLRLTKGWTQEELAQQIGLTRAAVSQWEKSEYVLNAADMKTLAKTLETTVSHFLVGMSLEEFLATPITEPHDHRALEHFGLKVEVLRYTRGCFT